MRKVDPVKHARKRSEILDAAIRCFVRHGFRGASTTDICAEAGISPGHLYHYFPSKEAIIEEMTEVGLAHSAERFERILAAPDVIEAMITDFEQTGVRLPPAQALSLEALAEAARNPTFARILVRYTDALRDLLAEFLRKAQAQGKVDPSLDPDTTANILIAMTDGIRALPIRNPNLQVAQNMDHLKTMLHRFLSPPLKKIRASANPNDTEQVAR